MKVGDLVHISAYSPLYRHVGGVGIIVSTMPTTLSDQSPSQHYKIFINGSLCPYYFTKNELEPVEET
jgi:hypothetical protein